MAISPRNCANIFFILYFFLFLFKKYQFKTVVLLLLSLNLHLFEALHGGRVSKGLESCVSLVVYYLSFSLGDYFIHFFPLLFFALFLTNLATSINWHFSLISLFFSLPHSVKLTSSRRVIDCHSKRVRDTFITDIYSSNWLALDVLWWKLPCWHDILWHTKVIETLNLFDEVVSWIVMNLVFEFEICIWNFSVFECKKASFANHLEFQLFRLHHPRSILY